MYPTRMLGYYAESKYFLLWGTKILELVTQILLLRGVKGREATRDGPGPERVRDSPRILEGR